MKLSNLFKSLDAGVVDIRAIYGRINDNFDAVKRILQNKISLRDNLYCDIVTGVFDSGSPRACRLQNLSAAKGAIVVGSSVPWIGGPVVGTEGPNAMVTLYFAGMAKSVTATVILFDEGSGQLKPQSILGAVNHPGILKPDGVTTFASPDGTLSSVGGSSGPAAPWITATQPIVADSRDENFTGPDGIGTTWAVLSGLFTATTPITPATVPAALHCNYSWNAARPGWLMLQPPADSNPYQLAKTVTFAGNDFVYVRVSSDAVSGSAFSGQWEFFVSNAALTNLLFIRWDQVANNIEVGGTGLANTPFTLLGLLPDAGAGTKRPILPAYFGLWRVGATWDAYVGTIDGSWFRFMSAIAPSGGAITAGYVVIGARNPAAGTPVRVGFGGVRFRSDGSLT